MHTPLLKPNLAKVGKLQFYMQKTAPGQKFRFWSLSTSANSTILQGFAHTPYKENQTKEGKLQFYKEKTALSQNFEFGQWSRWPILQFYKNLHIPLLKSKWLNYSSTEKRQLLVENFDIGHWPLWPILQFYRNMHTPLQKLNLPKLLNIVLRRKDSSWSKF